MIYAIFAPILLKRWDLQVHISVLMLYFLRLLQFVAKIVLF